MDAAAGEVRGDPFDLDARWMTEALEAAGVARGATVTDVVCDGDIGTGQAGRNARLRLTWDDPTDRPSSVIGKFPSGDPGTREMLWGTGIYLTEWLFYDRIAATVDVRAPHCHVARYDDDAMAFVLLMEDLDCCVQGDQIDGLSEDQLALAVEQAALLHAPRYGESGLDLLLAAGRDVTSKADSGEFSALMYEAALPPFLQRFGAELDEDVRAFIEQLGSRVAAWFAGIGSPDTLAHMDYRADNLLFGRRPEDPAIVVLDFQSLMPAPGAVDLAYLLSGSVADPAVRSEIERPLFDDWVARMRAAGVELAPDDAWRDYRYGSVWGVIMTVLASLGAETTDRGERMLLAMVQRHARQALDLDGLGVIS